MDWIGALKLVGIFALGFVLLTIAAAPGWDGKIFVLVIAGVGVWWYLNSQASKKVINPVAIYHDRLIRLCELKGKQGLRFLVMSGDAHNQRSIKGEILGGPVILRDNSVKNIPTKFKDVKNPDTGKIEKVACEWKQVFKFPEKWKQANDGKWISHPWHFRYVFLYTPSFGAFYSVPVIGPLFAGMRRKNLVTVFASQLRNLQMIGDVEIKGVNTVFVNQMEFISDELFVYDFEAHHLAEGVDRITFDDMLTMQPTRIRKAVDSNSEHVKSLDLKDTPVAGSDAT